MIGLKCCFGNKIGETLLNVYPKHDLSQTKCIKAFSEQIFKAMLVLVNVSMEIIDISKTTINNL